ncbi:MAG: hypothetical protein JXR64_08305 [Spirochaetales bacterium]|nr:hypothetical protein [Spirochaetales bacterium]
MILESAFKNYKEGTLEKEKFKNTVIEYAYSQVLKDKYIEAGDFIMTFIPKCDYIVDSYNEELASFTHYINKHIKWLMFSFSKNYVIERDKSDAYNTHYVTEFKENLYVMEENCEYKISPDAQKILSIKDGKILKDASRKRLEIFTLKNARNLSPEYIELIAPLLNRTVDWLYDIKEKLETICEKRVANRDYLQLRYNRLFIEITKDQKRILESQDIYEKDILGKRILEKTRIRDAIKEKIEFRNCGPKNEEIAKMLGIPKGTVDSSLFYMKKSLQSLLPNVILD